MEGAAAAPPHPLAAAAPGRPWSCRSGAPGCGDVSCARRCMAPAGSRGRPRPAAPRAPRPILGSGAPAAPAPAHRPPAGPPRPRPPRPRTPARSLTPGERGPAAPSRACPSRLAQRRGLRGPSIAQAPRSSLALSLLARRLCSRSLTRSHTATLTLPASHSVADAGAADARIYKVSNNVTLTPAAPPLRSANQGGRPLKGAMPVRSVCVGPAGRRWQPRLPRGHFCLGRLCASRLA